MKRVLCILTACVFILSALAACGDGGSAPAVTDAAVTEAAPEETTAEETELKPVLPDADYDGYTWTFLNGNQAAWMMTYVVTAEEENGEALNDAIYRRNRLVEEQFNINITEEINTSAPSLASKSVTAGDNAYDVFLLPKADSLNLVLSGSLTDYDKLTYVDISAPWWVQNAISCMSIGHVSYYGISLFDTTHYDGVRTLFFNKDMHADFNLPSIYDLVNDGKWTLDEMQKMGCAVASDLDGDGQWSAGDRYGYTTWYSIGAQTLTTGVNASLSLSKDQDDLPYFNMNNASTIERLEKVTHFINDTPGFNDPFGTDSNNGGVEYFKSGLTLFYNECMGNAQKLRQMDIDFGIIPAPKYNEAQDEYYHNGGNPYFMSVPVTATDLEMVSAVMEALAYESVHTVKEASYDIMLKGKVSRDDDSEEMLEIIFSSLFYLHPIAGSYVNTNIARDFIFKGNTDFASYFASNEEKINAEIEKYLAPYLERFGG